MGYACCRRFRLQRLPRIADFALWATACESAFPPAGTLETAYSNNRRNAVESIVDADPVAARVREIMADRANPGAPLPLRAGVEAEDSIAGAGREAFPISGSSATEERRLGEF